MKKQIQLLGGLMVFIALLTMNSTAFADFVIKGGGTVVVKSGTSLTANTNVQIETGGTLDNSGTVTLNANFKNDGNANLGTGSYVLSGSTLQEFGGTSKSDIDYLTVANTGDGVVLTGDCRVDLSLTLNQGLFDLSDYNFTLGPSVASVSGSFSDASMIITNGDGEIRKEFVGTVPTSFIYPLGDNNGTPEYSPLQIILTAGDFGINDYIGASVKNEKHPNNNSYDHYMNRYWSITTSGEISSLNMDAVGQYLDSDITGTETNVREGLFVSPEWFVYDPVNDALNTITFNNLSGGGDITGVEFQYLAGLKVFLQGAYLAGGIMRTDVNPILPNRADEAYSYYGYTGPEEAITIPSNAVDWVLVELREAPDANSATSSTIQETSAGFLLDDGSIVSVDGTTAIPFKATVDPANEVFFVIRHRNHIPVMSKLGSVKSQSTYIYDFSAPDATFGTNSMKLLETDLYGLYAGDANYSNVITFADKQPIDDNLNNTDYLLSDTNLSGTTNFADKQFIDENINVVVQLPY